MEHVGSPIGPAGAVPGRARYCNGERGVGYPSASGLVVPAFVCRLLSAERTEALGAVSLPLC